MAAKRTYYARVGEEPARDFDTIRECGTWVGAWVRARLSEVPLGTPVDEPKVFYIDAQLATVTLWHWTDQAARIFHRARRRAMRPSSA